LNDKRKQVPVLEQPTAHKIKLQNQWENHTILPGNQIAAANRSQYCDQQLDDPEPMRKQLQVFVLPFE